MSTEALKELFVEALDKEKTVLNQYNEILKKLKDKEIVDIIGSIRKDEIEHIKNIMKIQKLIN